MRFHQAVLFSIIAFSLCLLPRTGLSQSNFEFGGYLQVWYIADQEKDIIYDSFGDGSAVYVRREYHSGFKMRRARLMASGTINKTFSAKSWFELTAENRSLLDLYLDAKISDSITLRGGQMVMPGQSYNTSRQFSSNLRFVERPMISTKVSSLMGYNAFRDVGFAAYGTHEKLWYGLQISSGLGRVQQPGFTLFDRSIGSGLIGGRIDYELFEGLNLGAHISTNQQRNLIQNGSRPVDVNRLSWSLRASLDNFTGRGFFAEAEYISFSATDNSWDIATNPGESFKLFGFYTATGYHVTRNFGLLARYDYMNKEPKRSYNRSILTSNQYTIGFSNLIHHKSKEIARLHLNYSFSESGPTKLENNILVFALQLKFLP